MGIGPLVFAAPWALIALAALPALWLILRATPPAPKRVAFAPLRLLFGLDATPETPQSAPLWLILLRLFIAALVILALAQPVWRPDPEAPDGAPLLVVMDDGWSAAGRWSAAQSEARSRLSGAAADGRPAVLVFTAPDHNRDAGDAALFGEAGDALERLDAAEPKPWRADRAGLAASLAERLRDEPAARIETVWIAAGAASPDPAADAALARTLSARGALRVLTPPAGAAPVALAPPALAPSGLDLQAVRGDPRGAREIEAAAISTDGLTLGRTALRFEDGETQASAEMRLPLDLRNRIARVTLEGEASAGAVQLFDDAARRPRVGLIAPAGGEDRQPLLSDLYYLEEALGGVAEPVRAPLAELLDADPAALVMVDAARTEDEALARFVEGGGLLIRFAGPRLAARGDDLLPVRLRQGGRLFGGAMAWGEAQALSPFPDDSPFAGLAIPEEVAVERQVLAEPEPGLDAQVWARLDDGTPLVTWSRRGDGLIVLFHVTAGPDWSNLPLSGLFPRMLSRLSALGVDPSAAAPGDGAWLLQRALDGFGRLGPAPDDADPVPDIANAQPGPDARPGLYRLGAASAALNAVRETPSLSLLARDLPGAVYETLDGAGERRLAGPLLALAAILFAIDAIIALALAGRLPSFRLRRSASAAAILAAGALIAPLAAPPAQAQDLSEAETQAAIDKALTVRLGYVLTGDASIDRMSRLGVAALSEEITRRSAIEPAEPRAVDIEADPVLFFPVLYWPVTEDAPALSQAAAEKVEAYMQGGGLIVFDTRDAAEAAARTGPHPGLARLLEAVDVPPLQRAPSEHVLTRTFYLLDGFPGRFAGGAVWVEAGEGGSAGDGASAVVIGSADWAAAWARTGPGDYLAPVEGGARQREMAYRFGVNLAMYALTGNYKADQVHVQALLDRLGAEP